MKDDNNTGLNNPYSGIYHSSDKYDDAYNNDTYNNGTDDYDYFGDSTKGYNLNGQKVNGDNLNGHKVKDHSDKGAYNDADKCTGYDDDYWDNLPSKQMSRKKAWIIVIAIIAVILDACYIVGRVTDYVDSTNESPDASLDNSVSSFAENEADEDSSEATYAVIDEATGKELFNLISYDDKLIFSFTEPDGWTVKKKYLEDTVNNTDIQFFLKNDEISESVIISCNIDYGVLYYYDEEKGDAESAQKYSLEETGFITANNPDGYDIFRYTYTYGGNTYYYYIAILYGGRNSSLAIKFPMCEEFDTLEEVEAFLM